MRRNPPRLPWKPAPSRAPGAFDALVDIGGRDFDIYACIVPFDESRWWWTVDVGRLSGGGQSASRRAAMSAARDALVNALRVLDAWRST